MIFTLILNAFDDLIVGLVGLLPTGHLPVGVTTAFAYFMGLLNSFSFFIPVDTLLQAAGVILVFDGALIVWYFANWIIRKIPGMQ